MDTFSVTKEQGTSLWGRIVSLSQLRISLLGDPVPQGEGGDFVSSWNKLKCICLPVRRIPAPRGSKASSYSSMPGAKPIFRDPGNPGSGTEQRALGRAAADPRPVPWVMHGSLMSTATMTQAFGWCPLFLEVPPQSWRR